MAFETDDAIGTGQTYTNPATWEAATNTSTFTGDRRGRCLGEEFTFTTPFFIQSGNTNAHWLILTANDGDEHDGRSHEVSGAGNSRITGEVSAPYEYIYFADAG